MGKIAEKGQMEKERQLPSATLTPKSKEGEFASKIAPFIREIGQLKCIWAEYLHIKNDIQTVAKLGLATPAQVKKMNDENEHLRSEVTPRATYKTHDVVPRITYKDFDKLHWRQLALHVKITQPLLERTPKGART